MPILSTVGRKQRKMRLVIAGLYLALAVGAVTMVYPFLLMISLSFTSPVDQHEFRVIPRYWYDDAMLFRKYLESKYDEDINYLNRFHACDEPQFEDVEPPAEVNEAAVREWQAFGETLPLEYVNVAHQLSVSKITPEGLWRYRRFLQKRFEGDLDALNEAYREANENWNDEGLSYPVDQWQDRQTRERDTRKYKDFVAFKRSLKPRYRIPVSMDGMWWDWLSTQYGKDLDAVRQRHERDYATMADVHLSERLPANAEEAEDWTAFVRREIPFHYVRLEAEAAPAFRESLRKKYGSLEAFNRAHGSQHAAWDEVAMAPAAPREEAARLDWCDFVSSAAPPERIRLRTPEVLYREWLLDKHGSLEGVNEAHGAQYASVGAITPPRRGSDWVEMLDDRRAVRREFVVRNYRDVTQYILLHGRALWNTVVLVVGLLTVTLIVNPLAAYALSRYELPATYKILLFLLATMAFPAEVTMIPGFLLLKSAHLLNTYWALILPTMASGYSIFLLKGFFDSLPRDLYEAALLDGAPEWMMFAKITVPLSKPVLAVIALTTFTFAYGSFMWAFLVCQDPRMWTLMVWLFQMQVWAPQFMILAALVLAAIPTLLVFVFCQNIIMRGIILPVEK